MYDLNVTLWISYVIFIIVTFCFSLLTNFLFLRFVRTLGIRNSDPKLIRWSAEAKPSLGGMTFFITFLFSVSAYSFIFEQNDYFRNPQSIGIIIACTIGFLMGLHDDAYNTKVSIKLFTQIACGIILISTGTYINITDNQIINYIITIFWVVGIMNSLNMLDNMDAISALVSLFIILTAIISLFLKNDYHNPYSLLLLGILAAIGAFLIYNWHPSKMIMGDTGSQFLGILLAVIGILYFWNADKPEEPVIAFKQIMIVMTLYSLLLIDTSTVFIKRIIAGGSPFVGGKDHTTHHLSYLGLTDRQVAYAFILLSIFSMLITISLQFWIVWSTMLGISLLIYFFTLFGALFYIANLNK